MKRRRFFLAASIVVILSMIGCTGIPASKNAEPGIVPVGSLNISSDMSGTITHDGKERVYFLHIPPAYNRSTVTPLIIALHGGGGTGRKMNINLTDGLLNEEADNEGFIVVYPEGVGRRWNDGRNPDVWRSSREDDVGFISVLIDHLSRIFNIDPNRVYAAGISNGGMMSFRLAIELSDKIAAIATVTACLPEELSGSSPSCPVSVMIINGTDDPLMPFNGGKIKVGLRSYGKVISTQDTVAFWVEHNKCIPAPETSLVEDTDPDDRTRVKVDMYQNGLHHTEVVLYTVQGGGHTWPGGKQYLRERFIGRTCRDIDASKVIIEFFKEHAKK